MIPPPLTRQNTLVIVPALNEEGSIAEVLSSLQQNGHCVVVVSDGSSDATAEIARNCGVDVLELAINLGVGGALRAGFKFACKHDYQAVIQVDADGQHPVDHIDKLIAAANDSSADLVVGSRFIDVHTEMSVSCTRRITMRFLAWSASRATRSTITDSTSGFRLVRQPLLERFSHSFASNYLGDTYEALIAAGRAGFVVEEISAPISERLHGESSSSSVQSFLQTIRVFTVALLQIHNRI